MKHYKVFKHTADLGLEIYGRSLPELFTHAALALFELLTDLHRVKPNGRWTLAVSGTDREDLLVNYLREVLYLYNGKGLLLSDFSITDMEEGFLRGEARGESFDASKHTIKKEIKAVTYHQASIRQTAKGWQGRIVVDV
ncbi:MAG: archease [Deltaproteobacteria bacterium]|nr:archease [Deltaproteobacteria bacterium]